MWTPLILGDFVFDEGQLEVPERFGDLAGTQSIQQHDFPGGVRSQRSYGYFPSPLQWNAKFSGQFAAEDLEAVKRILFAGKEVRLQYGDKSWLGRLHKFTPVAHNQWLYEYSCEFWPRQDTSSGFPAPPTFAGNIAILGLHIETLKGLISGAISPNLLLRGLATFFLGPVALFVDTVTGSLLGVGGVIGKVGIAQQQAISIAALAALAAARPYQNSQDPTESSPAWDAVARIKAISNIMTAQVAPASVIQVINPNLPSLAAQYYGSASRWRTIAAANNLADPMPIGSFTLNIPPAQ